MELDELKAKENERKIRLGHIYPENQPLSNSQNDALIRLHVNNLIFKMNILNDEICTQLGNKAGQIKG